MRLPDRKFKEKKSSFALVRGMKRFQPDQLRARLTLRAKYPIDRIIFYGSGLIFWILYISNCLSQISNIEIYIMSALADLPFGYLIGCAGGFVVDSLVSFWQTLVHLPVMSLANLFGLNVPAWMIDCIFLGLFVFSQILRLIKMTKYLDRLNDAKDIKGKLYDTPPENLVSRYYDDIDFLMAQRNSFWGVSFQNQRSGLYIAFFLVIILASITALISLYAVLSG